MTVPDADHLTLDFTGFLSRWLAGAPLGQGGRGAGYAGVWCLWLSWCAALALLASTNRPRAQRERCAVVPPAPPELPSRVLAARRAAILEGRDPGRAPRKTPRQAEDERRRKLWND